MSLHRRAAKRDANEREIIKAAESLGAEVRQLSSRGIPDLLVGYRGVNYLWEVKVKSGKLTEDQEEFEKVWTGQSCVIRTAQGAVDFLMSKR